MRLPDKFSSDIDQLIEPNQKIEQSIVENAKLGYKNRFRNVGTVLVLNQGVTGQSKKYKHNLTVSRANNDVMQCYGEAIGSDHHTHLGYITCRSETLRGGNAQIPVVSTKLY
jgi:hypothetical protein